MTEDILFATVDPDTFLPPERTVDALRAVIVGGVPAGPTSYVHTQSVAANVWIIDHDLSIVPNVTVVDSAGSVVIGGVHYLSDGSIKLTFAGAFSGKAYLS